jgi:hypothetical protein
MLKKAAHAGLFSDGAGRRCARLARLEMIGNPEPAEDEKKPRQIMLCLGYFSLLKSG